MTEEEAKTKWCPFARYGGAQGQHGNRTIEGSSMAADVRAVSRCIGSACMAWRQDAPEDGPLIKSQAATGTIPGPDWGYDVANHLWTLHKKIPHGFCGLAGKP